MKELLDLFWSFFKIGLFTFGGGMAMIPLIERVVVDDHKWLEREEMLDCLVVGQSMPGVIAINVATYVGKRKQGIAGAIATTLGVIMPSFLIIIILVAFLSSIGDNKYVEGAFKGIKAAVCGLIVVSCIRLGKQAFKNIWCWIIGIAAFVLVAIVQVTAIWVIIGAAVLGILHKLLKRGDAS